MRNGGEARRYDRRRFVQLAGAGAAGLALAGRFENETAGAATSGPISLRVGVLTPTGSSYSKMGQSLLDGLALGFHDAHVGSRPLHAKLVRVDVDRGYDGATTKAQALLDGGANVVVAGVSALVADRLAPLFEQRKTPLVVAGVGAHVVTPNARSSYVLHNSLLYWQASFAAGKWAATHAGKRAFIASSINDSGYDAIYAFRCGFESAGGKIVGESVTHMNPVANGLSALFSAVHSSRANVLYGVYSGHRAAQFVQAYSRSGVKAHLVAGSFAVEDFLLGSVGKAAIGATSCASWTSARRTEANESFARAFKVRFGRAADPFAALGYDTALLVAKGTRRAVASNHGSSHMIRGLAGASVSGPRGVIVVDGATNSVVGPLHMRQVHRTTKGLVNIDFVRAPAVGTFPRALSKLGHGTVGGYINEYLCA